MSPEWEKAGEKKKKVRKSDQLRQSGKVRPGANGCGCRRAPDVSHRGLALPPESGLPPGALVSLRGRGRPALRVSRLPRAEDEPARPLPELPAEAAGTVCGLQHHGCPLHIPLRRGVVSGAPQLRTVRSLPGVL